LIRQPFAWAEIERAPGELDFGRHDEFVAAAAEAGVRVLPMIVGPEPGSPKEGRMRPPRDTAAYGRFAAAVAERYGPAGTLWSERDDIPRLPIRSWQVWNEPNIPAWWATGPDPAAYAKLLEAAARELRGVDPDAEIVAAGLPDSHLGVAAREYLDRLYEAGAKESLDTVAIHGYAPSPREVVAKARDARAVIDSRGDDARLWVTEFGWGTGGKPGELTVDRETQARYIGSTLERFAAQRRGLGLRGVVLFQWRDPNPFPGRRAIWPYFAGLLEADGTPKPSLEAFSSAARAISAGARRAE